jgi:hypothetical protein
LPHASPFGDRVHTSVGVSSGTSSRPGARKKLRADADCPFGWPEPFVVAASKFAAGATWPPDDVLGLDRFALRHTDLVVKKRLGLRPLAVAADRIGRTAMHWTSLQKGLGSIDRTGRSGLVTEVYPAATLKRWGLLVKGLKGTRARRSRSGFAPPMNVVPLRGFSGRCTPAVLHCGAKGSPMNNVRFGIHDL